VSWLELSGSLGRGAGDESSDVDAGIGVDDSAPLDRLRDKALLVVRGFAAVADALVQPYGERSSHLVVQYADGRQLSLVVMPADDRPGLPPGAVALLDRTGQLATPWQPAVLHASAEQQREWAFLAWWGLGDVAKHARRGSVWRALTALNEVRDCALRLHAAALDVDYPGFAAVSLENAGVPVPQGLWATLPGSPDAASLLEAGNAMAAILGELTAGHGVDGVRQVMWGRLLE
jgi:hypothetical protein